MQSDVGQEFAAVAKHALVKWEAVKSSMQSQHIK